MERPLSRKEMREKAILFEIMARVYEREPERMERAQRKQPLSERDSEILEKVHQEEEQKAEKLFQALDLGLWPDKWPRGYVPQTDAARLTYAKYLKATQQHP